MKQSPFILSRFYKYNRWKQRSVIAALGILLVGTVVMARPLLHLAKTAWQDTEAREPPPEGFIDDASHMDLTEIRKVWPIPNDDKEAISSLNEASRCGYG